MATLKLTIYEHNDLVKDIALNTSSLTATYTFKDKDSNDHVYLLSLAKLDTNMQMYRPTEVLADISIAMNDGNDWVKIPRSRFEIFKDQKVAISFDAYEVGTDFYVHEVIPEYYSDYMHLKLKIYSPDKLLTLRNTSRTFVGKRLSEILTSELKKYSHPADEKVCLKFNTDNLQVLKFERLIKNKVQDEHMFPFLVQYNESIYDLLARTANRWGEFMYYRDGKLHFGYNEKQAPNDLKDQDKKNKYYKITYPSYNTDAVLTNGDGSGVYDLEAVYDKTVSDTPVEESPYKVKGELGKFNGAADKYFMRKIASFLGNDKDLITWLFNNLVDDSVSVAESVVYNKMLNKDLDGEYFTDENKTKYPLQFGEQEFTLYEDVKEKKQAYNQFTEYNSIYTSGKYKKILEAERASSKNLVQINFNTTSPDLKLGDLIVVDDERFIVVGVKAETIVTEENFIDKNESIISKTVRTPNFVVTAIARKDDKSIFYPTMLPSGHVRYSGPQKGAIVAANDPTLNHRVRVLFDWQYEGEETVEDEDTGQEIKMPKPIDDATEASPWLIFAAKGEGKPSTGRHVVASKVLVGFVDGNIERPYVMGYIQDKTTLDKTIDVDLDTDQGHYLRLSDGSRGAGLSSFLFGAFSPAASTISDFWPNFAFNLGKSAHLEGGFKLSDYYGIYKITGSSDQRNITISSPWGDVKMNAFTGITISAPNGDVKIKGKNVTIEAGNNLKLLSGTNVDYKFYQDKKYKGTSAATVLMSASAAIVNRLADKVTLLDLSIVRSVVEIVMRPVEGALTVKSSRFLKLEAGKNACEYPASAYNQKKRDQLVSDISMSNIESLRKTPLREGFVKLFKHAPAQAKFLQDAYNARYNECLKKKKGLKDAITLLQTVSEKRGEIPCKDYEGLKNVLWNEDLKKTKVEETELGFKEDSVGIKADAKTTEALKVVGGTKEKVIERRQEFRAKVLKRATELRRAIIALLKTDTVLEQAEAEAKKLSRNPPKDAGKNLYEATCKKNNKELPIYKIPDDIKNLTAPIDPIDDNDLKLIRRMFALNLLDKYKLTEGLTKPTKDNITDNTTWNTFIENLKVDDVDSIVATTNFDKWKDDMKGALETALGDLNPVEAISKLKGPWDERQSWDNNNRGSILFGANEETYQLGTGDNPQMQIVEKVKPLMPAHASNEFLAQVQKNLKGI